MARSTILSVVAIVVALAVGIAVGYSINQQPQTQQPEKVTFMLDWVVGGVHAPYYAAVDKGFYLSKGISVSIIPGSGTNPGIAALISGNADFAFLDAATISAAQAKDPSLALKQILMIYQKAPYITMYLKTKGINKPQDLVGKTAGLVPGAGLDDRFPVFLQAVGVDPKSVNVVAVDASNKWALFAAGRFDVSTAYAYNYPRLAEQAKQAGHELGVWSWKDYVTGGLPYANGILTSGKLIQNKPKVIKAFVEGTIDGWLYTRDNPLEASKILAKYNPQLKAAEQVVELETIFPFVFTDDVYKEGFGMHNESNWGATIDWTKKYLGVKEPRPLSELYTNEFIPKVIPKK